MSIQKLEAIAVLMNFNLLISKIVTSSKIGDVDFLCYGDLSVKNFYSIRSAIDFKARRAEYEQLLYKFANFDKPDAPCTMIFTSCSTGKHKGVIFSAYNILNAANVNYVD